MCSINNDKQRNSIWREQKLKYFKVKFWRRVCVMQSRQRRLTHTQRDQIINYGNEGFLQPFSPSSSFCFGSNVATNCAEEQSQQEQQQQQQEHIIEMDTVPITNGRATKRQKHTDDDSTGDNASGSTSSSGNNGKSVPIRVTLADYRNQPPLSCRENVQLLLAAGTTIAFFLIARIVVLSFIE